ncbi:MAG: serine hydrolase [Deinococcaceae bacterium]
MHKWWMAGMLALGGGVGAQMSVVPSTLLETIFKSPKLEEKWFSKEFLAKASTGQVETLLKQISGSFGAYKSLKQESEYNYTVELEKAFLPVQFALNAQGQVAGFLIKSPQMKSQDMQEALQGFKALSGTVSVFVSKNGKPILEMNADKPLAVGSAFKLAVLKTLKGQIQAGKRSWKDVVVLEEGDKSLPSGTLQTWPDGSNLTIETLASLMISVSDNTATDVLIKTLGRKTIEATLDSRHKPFLTTQELFLLKFSKDKEPLKKYLGATLPEKYALLDQLKGRPLPKVEDILDGTVQIEPEWFFSTQELCSLMSDVADLPLMSINPGVASASDWKRVSYKGGSEPGVLNLTTQVVSKENDTYCISTTWNDNKTLDENPFALLHGSLIGAFKK